MSAALCLYNVLCWIKPQHSAWAHCTIINWCHNTNTDWMLDGDFCYFVSYISSVSYSFGQDWNNWPAIGWVDILFRYSWSPEDKAYWPDPLTLLANSRLKFFTYCIQRNIPTCTWWFGTFCADIRAPQKMYRNFGDYLTFPWAPWVKVNY